MILFLAIVISLWLMATAFVSSLHRNNSKVALISCWKLSICVQFVLELTRLAVIMCMWIMAVMSPVLTHFVVSNRLDVQF